MSTLIAGVGNIFCGDDAFGVAVAHQLRSQRLPEGVRLIDVGTRTLDLTYTLLDGWDLVVLVDAAGRGKPPGTLSVLELSPKGASPPGAAVIDAHALRPEHVLASASAMGAQLGRVLLVGCEPETLTPQAGGALWTLSPAVSAAIEPAARLVERLVNAPGTLQTVEPCLS